jgi:hypothetical protein
MNDGLELRTIDPIHIISLGAGVQSSTMALMAACGEITPMPTAAIFADTQAEPKSVYVWLDWLEKQLPFPVHRVTRGSLAEQALKMKTTKDGRRFTTTDIPFWTLSADNQLGRIPQRQCTYDFKIAPIQKMARKIAQIKRGQKTVGVIQWIGISLDEVSRMKDSREPWQENRWPLIEKRISRVDCVRWMHAHGFPKPPRSACVFCPFHNNHEWRRLKTDEPDEFEKAVQFEKAKTDNMRNTLFLHRSCIPLDKIDFSTEEERGQLNMFNNECEGMCGV